MHQVEAFFETIYDALGADIAAAGGFKAVAAKVWPSVSPATATQTLRNALNVDQPHKLAPDEMLAIKRLAHEAGSFATVNYEAQALGYRITWLDPKDEADELRRDVRDLLGVVAKKLDRIERADERAALKVVR